MGAGKTSLLIPMARFIVERESSSGKLPLVIIENEIGEAGIDDKVLKAGGFQVRELFAGCVCCQLTAELAVCFKEVAENFAPQWVVLEATGVAVPGKIVGALSMYASGLVENIKTVVVVDAGRWQEFADALPLPGLQVADADLILINKTDLVSPKELASVEASVRSFNPCARIIKVSARMGVDPAVWQEVLAQNG